MTQVLTRTEELVLLAVWNLQDDAYGASIRDHLSDVTGHDWSFGAVYIPLERLVTKGYCTSYKGEATSRRGGRRKRYFTLTREGVAALNTTRRIQNILWENLPPVVFRDG